MPSRPIPRTTISPASRGCPKTASPSAQPPPPSTSMAYYAALDQHKVPSKTKSKHPTVEKPPYRSRMLAYILIDIPLPA